MKVLERFDLVRGQAVIIDAVPPGAVIHVGDTITRGADRLTLRSHERHRDAVALFFASEPRIAIGDVLVHAP